MSSDVSNSLQKWVRLPPNSGLTDLKPVSIYDVTKFPDTRTQNLRSLLEQGHVTVAPLRDPELILHMGRPFIHLAYAYEFRSKEVATQALSQGCTEYNALHTLLDQAPPDSSKYKTGSLAVVFESMRQDPQLDDLFNKPGINNINLLSQEQNLAVVLEHWNAWEVINPLAQLEESCDLAVLLALSNGNPRDSFDLFNVHIMTVAHALRMLWHYFPTSRGVSILKQYALFGIMTYICQLRPQFSLDWI
ncbi:hypothetical protein AnigIFM63326_001643 [Aspergillus niger]|nr:hypothetical protein AnigIFM63326_001643 [Aspergillus niger]